MPMHYVSKQLIANHSETYHYEPMKPTMKKNYEMYHIMKRKTMKCTSTMKRTTMIIEGEVHDSHKDD